MADYIRRVSSEGFDYCLVYSEHRQRSIGLPRGCSAAGVSTAGGECSSSDGDILDVEEEGIRDHGPGTVFAYACVRVRVCVRSRLAGFNVLRVIGFDAQSHVV